MASSASGPRGLRRASVGRAVAAFLAADLAVVLIIGAVLAWAERREATAEAIRDARSLNHLEATDVVGSYLRDPALHPGAAQEALDGIVRARVLGSSIVRVKVWDAASHIVYSDDASLLGAQFRLGDDELAALRSGQTVAEVSDLGAPENRDERRFGKLLEVYEGVRTVEGTPLLFETYQPYGVISASSARLFRASLPVLLGGLALLYVATAPLAYRLARRLRTVQDERESLLLANFASADRERSAIAADLHDGVVQGLAGASYELAALAERNHPEAALLRRTSVDLRRWVRELRTLIVTITPPALQAEGLEAALRDLLAPLQARDVVTSLEVEDVPADLTTEQLLFRVAQEGVRNVVRHAEATEVTIRVRSAAGGSTLEVEDNGSGAGDLLEARGRGSVGLELLNRLVDAQGGRLSLRTRPQGGTRLRVELP